MCMPKNVMVVSMYVYIILTRAAKRLRGLGQIKNVGPLALTWYSLHAKDANLGGSDCIPPQENHEIRSSEIEYESDFSTVITAKL